MEALDYWRLCDEVSVVQAALLIVGEDPSHIQDDVDGTSPQNRPAGYDAVVTALGNAIFAKRLSGKFAGHDPTGGAKKCQITPQVFFKAPKCRPPDGGKHFGLTLRECLRRSVCGLV